MEKQVVEAFMKAVQAANIESYQFDSDLSTRFYHNPKGKSIAKPNYDINSIVSIRSAKQAGSHNVYGKNVEVDVIDFCDIHEARTAGDYKQIKAFCESIGTLITDEEFKIILEIDKRNMDLIPETGNYVDRFHYLTDAQIAELSEEEKADYKERLEKYEKERNNYLGQNQAARITIY